MSDNLQPGDLVTAKQSRNLESVDSMVARRQGTWEWNLWIPRSSIMTIIKMPPPAPWWTPSHHLVVTVLHDGTLLEVPLINVERLSGVEQ